MDAFDMLKILGGYSYNAEDIERLKPGEELTLLNRQTNMAYVIKMVEFYSTKNEKV